MEEKENKQESLTVNWLVSVLIHFPEIYALNFNVNQRKFKFSYMLNEELEDEQFFLFKDRLLESLKAYEDVIMMKGSESEVSKTNFNGLTLVEVIREIKAISLEEISIVNSLTRDYFGSNLVREKTGSLIEFKEDLMRHEELIKHLTINYSSSKHENIFAFRQEGKVFVFDK